MEQTEVPVALDGGFIVNDVLDGDYQVHVRGLPEGYYVKGMLSRSSANNDTTISVRAGAEVGVQLGSDGARIDGQVQDKDGRAVGGAGARRDHDR